VHFFSFGIYYRTLFEQVFYCFVENGFSPARLAKIILSLSKDDFCGVVK